MPIKKYKPTTPGRRGMTSLSREEITANKPEKSLLAPLNSKGGRNNNGRITTRHQVADTNVLTVSSTLNVIKTVSLLVLQQLNTIQTVPLTSLC